MEFIYSMNMCILFQFMVNHIKKSLYKRDRTTTFIQCEVEFKPLVVPWSKGYIHRETTLITVQTRGEEWQIEGPGFVDGTFDISDN